MKKIVLLALALSLVSAEALAISRYSSQSMSCSRIQDVLKREKAAILRFTSARTPGLPLYDRYVEGDAYCSYGEYAEVTWIPANDTRSCQVFVCKEITYSEHS